MTNAALPGSRLEGFAEVRFAPHGGGSAPGLIRTGVERGMIGTIAIAGPLLVLQSLSAFAAERAAASPLVWASLALVVLACVVVPLSLLRRPSPASAPLLVAVAAYVALVLAERFELRGLWPAEFTPWLVSLLCIPLAVLAVVVSRLAVAAPLCAALIAAAVGAYIGRASSGDLLVATLGLGGIAAGLLAGVRALRQRAARADEAQRAAQARFDVSRREHALEEERISTDALLHDTVLGALISAGLTTSDGRARRRVVLMAQSALCVVMETPAEPRDRSATSTLPQALEAAADEFAVVRDLVEVDLERVQSLGLPTGVADALVAAMLQALSNSVKHAGRGTTRVARGVAVGERGIRLVVEDDGCGFEVRTVDPQRLGVRVSIIERVRRVGGNAEIHSAPGRGTTVVLEWRPLEVAGAEDRA